MEYGSIKTYFARGCEYVGKDCIQRTTLIAPGSKKLQKFWNDKISLAIKQIYYVKQPLKKELLAGYPELIYIFKKW